MGLRNWQKVARDRKNGGRFCWKPRSTTGCSAWEEGLLCD